jgi:DNA polymerase
MKTLCIDIETYSPVNLLKAGCYPYAEHPDFELLLFGYSVDGEPVKVIDVAQGEEIPEEIIDALFDPDVIKRAFNANFEVTCLSAHFGRQLPIEQWRCTSVLALSLGMPGNLADVGVVCKLSQDKQKMGLGRSLISYFCIPCKPTAKNGGRTRNYPNHDPDKWALFKEYCGRDVETEMAVCEKLIRWDLPDHEWALWFLDQKINGRGVKIDRELVAAAIEIDEEIKAKLTAEFAALTGITKATKVAKLKDWLLSEHEIEIESLNKEGVKDLLKLNKIEDVERALQLRQELSKSSVAKYAAMTRSVCRDDRIRGMFQFCGANRTWRWAGRLVQMQNLAKSDLTEPDLALARQLVKERDVGTIELCYGRVTQLLSELIRSAFIAKDGCRYAVVDFAAIEARVVAWAAGCEWRLEVFRTHGRIYEASAAAMFKVPLDSIGKKSPLDKKARSRNWLASQKARLCSRIWA